MKEIPLNGKNGTGKAAKVDDALRLPNSSFYLDSEGYPRAHIEGKETRLHSLVLPPLKGQHVDHINGDKLDNRRANLRYCSNSANQLNRTKTNKNNKSGYRNVCLVSKTGKYMAQVQSKNGDRRKTGFEDPVEAALAAVVMRLELGQPLVTDAKFRVS